MPTQFSSGPLCTRHGFSDPDRSVIAKMREMTGPSKGKLRGIEARPVFDEIIRHTAAPARVSYREGRVGGVAGWWCEPAGAPADRAILHLHGGWFNWGKAEAFRSLVGHMARGANANAFIPDYRLAPEHPFPSATVDAAACLAGMLEGDATVALTGDSAGGNLALVTLTGCSSSHRKRIAGAVVLSPVTDLTLSGESWASRGDADPIFVKEQVQGLVDAYLAGHAPDDPVASPLFADLSGLPPVRVHVGDAEVLLDDSLRWAEKAAAAGVDVHVDIWDGMPHGFTGNVGELQAADGALTQIGAFLVERFAARSLA
jgi:epsilon-lactone hydrolase